MELKGKENKDCKIFIEEIEPAAIKTIYNLLDSPAFKDKSIRIMPDVHEGKGIVIGFTSELGDCVNPNHVGVDIGCGLLTEKIEGLNGLSLEEINEEILRVIPMGFNYNQNPIYKELDYSMIESHVAIFIRNWNKRYNDNKERIVINEKYITNLIKKVDISSNTFYNSIGTLGGGNHFIELGLDEEGYYWLTIHTGSRNFGLKVCEYHCNQAKKQIGMPNKYLYGDYMFEYCVDMVIAQYYAKLNRETILLQILRNLRFTPIQQINSIHNYIDFDHFFIRKGAISALKGELCVIPFNMRDGLLICEGKGNADWNYSAPHGAGRISSRSQAKKNISMEDYNESMKDVYSTCICKETLDESPMAYKDSKLIEVLIEPTVGVLHKVKPVINIKAK